MRKRKLLPLTSEDRLNKLLSIYSKIPVDSHKKIESSKEILSNIIKKFHRKVTKNLK